MNAPNMSLRVAIVDDEPLARMRIRTLLSQTATPNEVVGEFGESVSALMWLQEQDQAGQSPDMVVLDIQMPGLDGMVLAARLRDLRRPPSVVFVTAHAEHALRAFDLAAADYLTKPVRLERLDASLDRVRKLRAALMPAPEPVVDDSEVLVVQERGRVERIRLAEVLYFKAEQKYVTVRTTTRSYIMDGSLSELEAKFAPRFLRIHRNALVARRAVRALEKHYDPEEGEGWAVRLQGSTELLAVSRRQVAAVREELAR